MQNLASDAALTSISGGLSINDGSKIHNQESFMESFISTVSLSNSNIYDIEVTRECLRILSSNITMNNMQIFSINNPNSSRFISIGFDSRFEANNITYSNSNSKLFEFNFIEFLSLKEVSFVNINTQNNLMTVFHCSEFLFEDLTLSNTTSENEALVIDYSSKTQIRDINVKDQKQLFMKIRYSEFDLISNVIISNYSQGIKILDSIISNISDLTFEENGSNSLLNGGALLIQDSEVTIHNSVFKANKAISGAAVSYLCKSIRKWSLLVGNSTFIENKATEKGGAIYYNYKNPVIDGLTQFNLNLAPYGNNLASYPVRIGLINSTNSDYILLNNITSGIKFETPLELALLDNDNQVMVMDNSSVINILPLHSNASVKGINVVAVKEGIALFDSLIVVSEPGSKNIEFTISSKSIDSNKVALAFNNKIVQSKILIDFSYWKPGEQVIGSEWYECPAGTYSFEWNSTEWHQWINEAVCQGRREVQVSQGYWRRNTATDTIVECLYKDSWLGGYFPENEHPVEWAEGYTGKLCSQWIISPQKYEKVNDFQCQKWPSPFLNSVKVIAFILLVFSFFMVIIITNVRKEEESEFSILLRILTNYFQLITTSLSFTSKFPDSLTDIFIPIKRFGGSSDAFLSFDWFVADYEIQGPFGSNAILKLFLLMLLPLILFWVVSIIWLIIRLFKQKWVTDLKRNLVVSFISILFLLHPKLAEAGINSFRWIKIDSSKLKVFIFS